MSLLPRFAWLLALAATTAQADLISPRIFDIVPPEGREVQWVDGYTVLRQPGARYGAVLSYVPESGVSAWIPVAVLNSGKAPLEVRQRDIHARYGDTELKVYDNKTLVREYQQRRREMLAYSQQDTEGKTMKQLLDSSRSIDYALGEDRRMDVGSVRDRRNREPRRNDRDAGSREAKELADAQLEALKERLFKDAELDPGRFNRGDVRIALPPRRDDGPAEFVLTLSFGGETMDVLYRERDPKVEVGVPSQAEEAAAGGGTP